MIDYAPPPNDIRWQDHGKPRLPGRELYEGSLLVNKESGVWRPLPEKSPRWEISHRDRIAEQLRQAALALKKCVEVNRKRVGGVPVLKGTRFTLSQLLAQIADGDSIEDLAVNFDLDVEKLSTLLHAFAAYLDRPFSP